MKILTHLKQTKKTAENFFEGKFCHTTLTLKKLGIFNIRADILNNWK